MFLVPSECVEGIKDRSRKPAAKTGTSAEECEDKQDRCYWGSADWNNSKRDWNPGECYYKKGVKDFYIKLVTTNFHFEYRGHLLCSAFSA